MPLVAIWTISFQQPISTVLSETCRDLFIHGI